MQKFNIEDTDLSSSQIYDLIIFTQYPKAYAPKRFGEEALKLGLTCKIKSYKYTDVNNLPDAKYVILREPTASRDIYGLRDEILNYYLSKKVKVLNSESYTKWSILDKSTQHKEFEKVNISHIKSYSLSQIPKLSYPFIVKARLGSHGSHVFKIANENDLDKVLLNHKEEDLLCQEFQKSGFDLRVIVIDSNVVGIMKRTPREGEFLSNYSQGGSVERYTGDGEESVKAIAIETAKHFRLDFAGVDLMKSNDDKWKVLEVNRACQFEGFEKSVDVNVAVILLESITKNSSKSILDTSPL